MFTKTRQGMNEGKKKKKAMEHFSWAYKPLIAEEWLMDDIYKYIDLLYFK